MAMSEYAEKSKYICSPKHIAPSQASKKNISTPFSTPKKILLAKIARLSANKIFLESPITKIEKPTDTFE